MPRVPAEFRAEERPTWCPACGDFAVLTGLQKAAARLDLDPDRMVVVTGIGCSGKLSSYFNSYGFHGIHGRVLPIAQGIKLANRDLTVIAAGGDGDGYGIGGNHFIHACRRNVDITYIVMDNHVYGLTKGQASPTSEKGFRTVTSPEGVAEEPVNPLLLALAAGAGFVAQVFSGRLEPLVRTVERAIRHRGFALVNVFTPCATFNLVNTYDWYEEHLVDLDADPAYDRTDRAAAMAKVLEHGGLVTGVVFEDPDRPAFEDSLPGYAREPLTSLDLSLPRHVWDALVSEV